MLTGKYKLHCGHGAQPADPGGGAVISDGAVGATGVVSKAEVDGASAISGVAAAAGAMPVAPSGSTGQPLTSGGERASGRPGLGKSSGMSRQR